MNRPNLFDHATSELTQDAVLCWLLSWADQRNKDDETGLYATGREFLTALLQTHQETMPDYSVSTKRQEEKIDIVARIGTAYLIGIEDKTDTGPHSNQLARYMTSLKELAAKENRTAIAIYVKTGEINEHHHIHGECWKVFGRTSLLKVLNQAVERGVDNAILLDFREYLQRKEAVALSWKQSPMAKGWAWGAWQGFYGTLEGKMPWARSLGWGYVANPSGGFLGLWWGFYKVGEAELYIQLQQTVLAIRLKVGTKALQASLSRQWSHSLLMTKDPAWALVRPPHMRSGLHMAIALWNDWRVTSPNGTIDLDATLQRLKELDDWLQAQAQGTTIL